MEKQLYRSRENRMIAGVCGGIAEYFRIDPTIVRLVWLLFTFTYGIGLIAYFIAAIVIPDKGYGFTSDYHENAKESDTGSDYIVHENHDNRKFNITFGSILVIIGLLLIGRRFFSWLDLHLLWPLALIAVGVFIIYNGTKRK